MPIEYFNQSEKFRPIKINTLLVGEAPPPNGKSYFYVPKTGLREESLPATIFNHYFGEIPKTKERYKVLLEKLRDDLGIFLIDIYEKPIRIREAKWKINEQNSTIKFIIYYFKRACVTIYSSSSYWYASFNFTY